jgi:hypothetical protein
MSSAVRKIYKCVLWYIEFGYSPGFNRWHLSYYTCVSSLQLLGRMQDMIHWQLSSCSHESHCWLMAYGVSCSYIIWILQVDLIQQNFHGLAVVWGVWIVSTPTFWEPSLFLSPGKLNITQDVTPCCIYTLYTYLITAQEPNGAGEWSQVLNLLGPATWSTFWLQDTRHRLIWNHDLILKLLVFSHISVASFTRRSMYRDVLSNI